MKKRDFRMILTLIVALAAAFQYITVQPEVTHLVQPNAPTPQPTTVLGESTSSVASASARVTKVVDGDTIRVSMDGKSKTVRLIGLNTPETVDPRREVQCFGKEASSRAREILSGQTVYLELDDTQGDKDKYQRLLRYVWLADGTNFNQLMIAEGYAYEYTYDLPYKYQREFKKAQIEAQVGKKGLWSDTTCNGKL